MRTYVYRVNPPILESTVLTETENVPAYQIIGIVEVKPVLAVTIPVTLVQELILLIVYLVFPQITEL